MSYLFSLRIGRFHFRDVEMLGLDLLHEYRLFHLNISSPSWSIQYANPDALFPMGNPMRFRLLLLASKEQNQVGLISSHQFGFSHLILTLRSIDVIVSRTFKCSRFKIDVTIDFISEPFFNQSLDKSNDIVD